MRVRDVCSVVFPLFFQLPLQSCFGYWSDWHWLLHTKCAIVVLGLQHEFLKKRSFASFCCCHLCILPVQYSGNWRCLQVNKINKSGWFLQWRVKFRKNFLSSGDNSRIWKCSIPCDLERIVFEKEYIQRYNFDVGGRKKNGWQNHDYHH